MNMDLKPAALLIILTTIAGFILKVSMYFSFFSDVGSGIVSEVLGSVNIVLQRLLPILPGLLVGYLFFPTRIITIFLAGFISYFTYMSALSLEPNILSWVMYPRAFFRAFSFSFLLCVAVLAGNQLKSSRAPSNKTKQVGTS